MRGKSFHNMIAMQSARTFREHQWQVFTEHRLRKDNIVTYLDLLVVKDHHKIACEIETTPRHVLDNVAKALIIGIELWIIVPTRTVRRQITRKLTTALPEESYQSITVLLASQLTTHLTEAPESLA